MPSGTQLHHGSGRPTAPAAVCPVGPSGYEIIDALGRGGMGVVYRAVQTDLGREVAIKMVLAAGHALPDELARFEAEMRSVASVRHPNVVEVYHAGQHLGLPFLAMEYVPGGTLADRLKDGPLPAPEAAEVVEAVARGVAACHRQNVLHRDLKPANVLLGSRGGATGQTTVGPKEPTRSGQPRPDAAPGEFVPKVSDFGLAKKLDGSDGVSGTHAMVGTPSCMAPEQVRGAGIGRATDVYGLGAVLYACLTGRPPFQAPTAEAAVQRVLHEEPVPVRDVQPGTPRDLETIALKCLAKDPARRYASADDLADDLGRWRDGKPIRARRAGPGERGWKWVRRNGIASGVMATLGLFLGVAVWQWWEARIALQRADKKVKELGGAVAIVGGLFLQGSTRDQAETGEAVDFNLPIREAVKRLEPRLPVILAGLPEVEANVRQIMADVFFDTKDYDLAAAQFESALRLIRPSVSRTDERVLTINLSLGEVYRQQKKYDEAEKLLLETLVACRETLGESRNTFKCCNNLGMVYQDMGDVRRIDDAEKKSRLATAEKYLGEAYEGRRRVLGEQHADTLKSANNLGKNFYLRANYENAERNFLVALAGRTKVLTEHHPDTIATMGNLAEVYDWWAKPDRAEPLFRKALDLSPKSEPAWTTAVRRIRLGTCLIYQHKIDEAKTLVTGGHADLIRATANSPSDQRRMARAWAEKVAISYADIGRKADAEAWEKTARDFHP